MVALLHQTLAAHAPVKMHGSAIRARQVSSATVANDEMAAKDKAELMK
jgi:hypothetical protein